MLGLPVRSEFCRKKMARFLCTKNKLSRHLFYGKTNHSGLLPLLRVSILTQQRSRSFILSNRSKSLNEKFLFHQPGLRVSCLSSMKNYPQVRNSSQKPASVSHGHDSVHISAASVVQRLHELEERMRVKGYSVLRWGLAIIAVTMVTIYFFREEVRENVADEVAGVASRSLGDENVVNKANEITKIVLQDIINDPETSRLASDFVTSVLNREDLRSSAVDLTLFVLRDPTTQQKVSELAASTLTDLFNRDEVRSLFLEYIKKLVLDESTRAACTQLIKTLLEDPQLKEFMAESLANLVASSVVKNKAVELGKNVTQQVVSDTTIQKETGDALWKVLKDSVTPSWFGGKPH